MATPLLKVVFVFFSFRFFPPWFDRIGFELAESLVLCECILPWLDETTPVGPFHKQGLKAGLIRDARSSRPELYAAQQNVFLVLVDQSSSLARDRHKKQER